jgi:hypothetical protein
MIVNMHGRTTIKKNYDLSPKYKYYIPVTSDVVIILWGSIIILTPNGQFLDWATAHSVRDTDYL